MKQQFSNGDKVVLKKEYQDKPGEVFTVSQAGEFKCWIGDSIGRGWYAYYSQLEMADDSNTDDNGGWDECEDCGELIEDCICDEEDEN